MVDMRVILILFAYVLGSVPWGLVIAKTAKGIDPRTGGSRSIGATNVSRLCGFGYGVATLVLDLLKGAIPVFLAQSLHYNFLIVSLVGFAAVLGHVFPCFLRFRGGKAVATTIGVFLPLAFLPLLAASGLCLLLIWISGFVSVGSLTLVSSLPLFLLFDGKSEWFALALSLCLLVFFRHKDNILRLHAGTEKPWIKSRHKEEADKS